MQKVQLYRTSDISHVFFYIFLKIYSTFILHLSYIYQQCNNIEQRSKSIEETESSINATNVIAPFPKIVFTLQ